MIAELSSAVISCIIQDASCLQEIELTPAEFLIDSHREIYLAARSLEESKEPIDIISISDLLQNKTGKSWIATIGNISKDSSAAPKNIKSYAGKLRDRVKTNNMRQIAFRITEKAESNNPDIEQELMELMRLNAPDSKYDYTMKEALSGAVDLMQSAMDRNGDLIGIPSGLSELDSAIGGFQNSDLYIIGARPSQGKTASLLNFANSSGVSAGIISTEQGHAQLGQRFIAMEGRVSGMKMRNSALDDNDFARVQGAVNKLALKNIFINDKSIMTISELSRQARKWAFDYDIKILYVDYLQRIKADNTRIPKHEQVDQVVTGLKTLAKELNIPIVSLAQVNREVEKRPDKRPKMGDLKGSGAVEQEADVIIMLYRDWVYNKDSNPSLAELSIEKNRHGATGLITCTFDREFMLFSDLTEAYDDER